MTIFQMGFLFFLLPLTAILLYFKIKFSYDGLKKYRTTEYTKWSSRARAGGSGMVRAKGRMGVQSSTSSEDCSKIAEEHYNKSNGELLFKAVLNAIPTCIIFLSFTSYMLHHLVQV